MSGETALDIAKSGSTYSKPPVEYGNMEFMFHTTMMYDLNVSAADASGYPIHGLEHFLVIAATQLEIKRDVTNQFGHWHADPNMPDTYNQTKCAQ